MRGSQKEAGMMQAIFLPTYIFQELGQAHNIHTTDLPSVQSPTSLALGRTTPKLYSVPMHCPWQ